MNTYIGIFNRILSEISEDEGLPALYDSFNHAFRIYLNAFPVCHDICAEALHLLEPLIGTLSKKRVHRIRYIVNQLCEDCEIQAFQSGFYAGTQFILSLLKNEPQQ